MLSTMLLYKMVLYLKKCTNDTGSTWSTVEPDTPWLVALSRISSKRAVRRFKCPEEQSIVGMVRPVHGNVTSPVASRNREGHIGQRLSHLVIWPIQSAVIYRGLGISQHDAYTLASWDQGPLLVFRDSLAENCWAGCVVAGHGPRRGARRGRARV